MLFRPFFSIIIPTLNEERYVPKLLSSLTAQYHKDFEVIIVDGSSTDKTVAVAQEFQSKTKRQFKTLIIDHIEANVGRQRNIGAKRSRGKYLVFLDADAQIPPNFLSRLREHIDRNHSPFITTWLEADSPDPQDKLIAFFGNMAFETAQYMEIRFVPGSNIIVTRGAFEKSGGFDEKLLMNEDHDLAKRLAGLGYQLTLLKEPRVMISLRRFRKEGTLSVVRRYAHSSIYTLFKGPIMRELFTYEMGGHLYRGKLKRRTIDREVYDKLRSLQKMLTKQLQNMERRLNGD